ncbi:MAG TPA: YMGG-like glycine zipper-containing protein [Rhizomicrobium sp.]|nr:YMGG-like glycine zipper-containing protein [Rhizomicrobium sp.]
MRVSLALVALLILSGCENMSQTQQRTLSGGAIGTAGGAIIGAMAGNAGLGAAIGAGVGLAGGYVYDRHRQAEERSFQQGVAAGRSGNPQ